jgi:hypothetical protein
VYELTGDFPGEERFGLTNQMRCAAASISSNIAEVSSGASRTDFARFVEIATGSLFEVASFGILPTVNTARVDHFGRAVEKDPNLPRRSVVVFCPREVAPFFSRGIYGL